MGMATITCKISYEDREKLNRLCDEHGLTVSELLRQYIRGQVRTNDLYKQIEEMKQMLIPLTRDETLWYIIRSAICFPEYLKRTNPESGEKLDADVKALAKKLVNKFREEEE